MNKYIVFTVLATASLHNLHAMESMQEISEESSNESSKLLWQQFNHLNTQIKEKRKTTTAQQELISLRKDSFRTCIYLLEENPTNPMLLIQLKKQYAALKKLEGNNKAKVKADLNGLADDLSDDESTSNVLDPNYQYFKKVSVRKQDNKTKHENKLALKKIKEDDDKKIEAQILAIMGQQKQLEEAIIKLKLQKDNVAKEVHAIELENTCIDNANDILERKRAARKASVCAEIQNLEANIKETISQNELIKKQLARKDLSLEERFAKDQTFNTNEQSIKETKEKQEKLVTELNHMQNRLNNEKADGWTSSSYWTGLLRSSK